MEYIYICTVNTFHLKWIRYLHLSVLSIKIIGIMILLKMWNLNNDP